MIKKYKRKNKNNNYKKAVSLPINMIIVVAIGFVLLILAIAWIKTFFSSLTSQTKDMNQITQQAINSLVVEDPNAKFFLGKSKITIQRGGTEAIAYQIQNFDNNGDKFYMAIECVTSPLNNGPYSCSSINSDSNKLKEWFPGYLRPTEIQKGKPYKDALIVSVPKGADPGDYVFKIFICKGSGNSNDLKSSCKGNDQIYNQDEIKNIIISVK